MPAAVVDVHILASSDAVETREHLVLADAELLRDAREILLVVGVVLAGRSGLDLVAVHVLDAATDGSRLGESRAAAAKTMAITAANNITFLKILTSYA